MLAWVFRVALRRGPISGQIAPGRFTLACPTVPRLFDAWHLEELWRHAALADVELSVRSGEVMALIGENGAGKSTLMKVLSGAHRPDAGEMFLDGRTYAPSGPHQAAAGGRGHDLSRVESRAGPERRGQHHARPGAHRYGWLRRGTQAHGSARCLPPWATPTYVPETPVRQLSVAARQLVEIARALVLSPKVIVFDEPTSSLDGPRRRAFVSGDRPAARVGPGRDLHQSLPRGNPPRRPAIHSAARWEYRRHRKPVRGERSRDRFADGRSQRQ